MLHPERRPEETDRLPDLHLNLLVKPLGRPVNPSPVPWLVTVRTMIGIVPLLATLGDVECSSVGTDTKNGEPTLKQMTSSRFRRGGCPPPPGCIPGPGP